MPRGVRGCATSVGNIEGLAQRCGGKLPAALRDQLWGARVARCEVPAQWVHEASCRGLGALFGVPESASETWPPELRHQVETARAICAQCVVLDACRAWALSQPDPAIGMLAGGLTPTERRRGRARQRLTVGALLTRGDGGRDCAPRPVYAGNRSDVFTTPDPNEDPAPTGVPPGNTDDVRPPATGLVAGPLDGATDGFR